MVAPLSKRKSCSDCVKAKRKCGMELPRCARCMKKDVACHYPNPHLASPVDAASSVIPGLEFSWLDQFLSGGSDGSVNVNVGAGGTMPWSGDLQPQLKAAAPSTSSNGNSSSSARSGNPSKNSGHRILLPAPSQYADSLHSQPQSVEDSATTTSAFPEEVTGQPIQAANTLPLGGVNTEPDYLQSPPRPDEATRPLGLSQSQTDAALHSFRTWPEKWVIEGKAPFINPRLYSAGMPKPLQDAYAACAIYSVKTAQNEAIAFTVIETKANELLSSYDESAWTPLDLLAAVQALVIFQFIRLFDGDIRQRAQAEEAQLVLQAWTDELEVRTLHEQTFTTETAPSWRSWIFAESVRRTGIISLNLAGVYSYLFHGFCTLGPKLKTYSFTAQRWLWEAKSSLEWDRVRQSRAPYWISELDFDHVLQAGQEDELDDFSVVMLIMVKGQDYFDDWSVSKHYTPPPIRDLHIGKNLVDLVQPPQEALPVAAT